MADEPQPEKLTPELKNKWNKFIEFVATQKMAGNPLLDQRNKQVGMGLLQKFNYSNPDQALPLDIVPKVQQELQDYRNDMINKWKTGKAVVEGVKDEDEIMPGLSPVDGWPGTKTLSTRFPVAILSTETPKGKAVKDYGTDTAQYDKDMGLASNK